MTNGSSLSEREARIEQVYMDPLQQRVFQMFVHLGHERSLPKLLALIKQTDNISVSEATLKRWSSKFKWVDLALRTDAEIADRIVQEALPMHVHSMQRDLDVIDKMKESFYERVEKGEIKVDLADYIMLLKTQALIMGDPTERKEIINSNKNEVTVTLTDAQMAEMMRFDAAQKHGLPPPVTIEHDDE